MKRPSIDSRRRGAVAVMVSVILVALLSCAALAIDLGYLHNVRAELQASADAAAMAAAGRLPDQAAAAAAAAQFVGLNPPYSSGVLSAGELAFGSWDADTATFTPGGNPLNAARVVTRRDASNGNPVGLFFAPIMGVNHADASAQAIAVGPRPGGARFLIDDEMFDTDLPQIIDLAASEGVTPDELLEDGDGDWFIDLPVGSVLELPTGQVGDSALFDSTHAAFPFGEDTSPSLEDFLNYNEDGTWRDMPAVRALLDPLVGVTTVEDPALYETYVNPDFVHVSPVYRSDVNGLNPVSTPVWANGAPAVQALGLRRGLIAFKIIGVGADPDGPEGSVLPNLVIEIADPATIDLGNLPLADGSEADVELVR